MYDLNEALERANQYLADAKQALVDEHEGNLKRALRGLRTVAAEMSDVLEDW